MFLIPIKTDAPIYHWPWMTLLLIVVNLMAFVITAGGDTSREFVQNYWLLQYGNGLHPIQWLTSNFLHFGVFHLIGNMVFLWGFGLVVEGKIGWWKYLLVYLGIGVMQSCLEQLIMLRISIPAGTPVGSGGASSIIYGLLAISLVWAPRNEVTCLMWFFIRVFIFDVTIYGFSMFYIGMQLLFAGLIGFQMSSEILHLMGATVGFVVAVAMLKWNWVDCENWDIFAVMSNTYGSRDEINDRVRARQKQSKTIVDEDLITTKAGPQKPSELRENTKQKIYTLLKSAKPRAALNEYNQIKHFIPNFQLGEKELAALAQQLYKARVWSDAVPFMQEYISRYPARDQSYRMRVQLAAVAIEIQERPKYAIKILDEIPAEALSADLTKHVTKMRAVAEQMIEAGVMELDGRSWM